VEEEAVDLVAGLVAADAAAGSLDEAGEVTAERVREIVLKTST
jgi:hypothetical protein